MAKAVGVQPTDRLSSLVDTVAGFPEGSLVQITQPVPLFQAWHKVQAVDAVANRLYWEAALEPQFLLTPPMTLTSFHEADLVVSQVGRWNLDLDEWIGAGLQPEPIH